MKIDGNTKLIARFHSKVSPRGLNIFNPYFEESSVNAIYLLFCNTDPAKLIASMRNINIVGAMNSGFESDANVVSLLDDVDEVARYVGKVGFIKNNGGKLTGYSHGGKSLLQSIENVSPIANKKIVVVGAGNMAKSFLFNIDKCEHKPSEVIIVNRDISKAEKLIMDFSWIKEVKNLSDLSTIRGDVLINATDIGKTDNDNVFTESIVDNFDQVADVTFEKENTNLVILAKKLNKKVSTGWDMFTTQGVIFLETCLDIKVNFEILKKHVVNGLSEVVV